MAKKHIGILHPSWDDMSEFVVHFTKKTGSRSAYENSLSILGSGRVKAANSFGTAKSHVFSPKVVCLSETPLHQLDRLAAKRSRYGIGFRKEYIVAKGGGPILYAYKGSPQAEAMKALTDAGSDNPNDPAWKLAPFVDIPGKHGSKSYFFEWEREWRVVGHLDFKPADVAFLILPAELHDAARQFFLDAEVEKTGPNYPCPFIDPKWSKGEVAKVLEKAA